MDRDDYRELILRSWMWGAAYAIPFAALGLLVRRGYIVPPALVGTVGSLSGAIGGALVGAGVGTEVALFFACLGGVTCGIASLAVFPWAAKGPDEGRR